MKLSRHFVFILLGVVIFSNPMNCSSGETPLNKVEKAIQNLLANNRAEYANSILFLHSQGAVAIPYLIENISRGRDVSIIDLSDPISSIYHFEQYYTGTILAYVIELILSEEKIGFKGFETWDLYPIPHVFAQGIVKKNNARVIELKDLDGLQKVYHQWWDQNKKKSIEDLRADYSTNPPLKNSCFQWF